MLFDSSSRFLLPCVTSVVIAAYLQESVFLTDRRAETKYTQTWLPTLRHGARQAFIRRFPSSFLLLRCLLLATTGASASSQEMRVATNYTQHFGSWCWYYYAIYSDFIPSSKGLTTKLYSRTNDMLAFVLRWMFSDYYLMVRLLVYCLEEGSRSSSRQLIHTTTLPISAASQAQKYHFSYLSFLLDFLLHSSGK